jgi:hypothetical protein
VAAASFLQMIVLPMLNDPMVLIEFILMIPMQMRITNLLNLAVGLIHHIRITDIVELAIESRTCVSNDRETTYALLIGRVPFMQHVTEVDRSVARHVGDFNIKDVVHCGHKTIPPVVSSYGGLIIIVTQKTPGRFCSQG